MAIADARTPVAGRARRTDALRALRTATRGELLTPDTPAYDAQRRGYNALVDRRPAAILCCAGASEVAAGIRAARENGWPLAVRGGGHSLAGFGMCDDGLALDLSAMNVLEVDLVRGVARAGPGVTWGEMDRTLSPLGVVVPGARISTTSVGGVTLGGGYGWLMRRDGLTIDSLVSATVVTAAGAHITASADENADLFWGLRGGGGNFGVVTSFEYRLNSIRPVVLGGAAFYAAEDLRELLRFYRELMRDAPDELTAQCNFLIAPDAPFVPSALRGVPVGAIAVCHTGSLDDAERDLRALRAFKQPVLDRIKPMPYTTMQRLFDAAGAFGHLVYGRSGHLRQLDDAVIDAIVDFAPRVTSPLSIVMISPLGGAVARVSDDATAFAHRAAAFDLAISAVWDDPSEHAQHVAWVEELWRAVAPHTNGVYVNELGDEGRARVAEAYPAPTYARLVALKNRYDPQNLFRLNQNIIPSAI